MESGSFRLRPFTPIRNRLTLNALVLYSAYKPLSRRLPRIKPLRVGHERASQHDQLFMKQLFTKLSSRGSALETDDVCVWVVMAENLLEISVFFRHGPGSRLAEPDAVSLAGSFKNDLVAFVSPGRSCCWERCSSPDGGRFSNAPPRRNCAGWRHPARRFGSANSMGAHGNTCNRPNNKDNCPAINRVRRVCGYDRCNYDCTSQRRAETGRPPPGREWRTWPRRRCRAQGVRAETDSAWYRRNRIRSGDLYRDS